MVCASVGGVFGIGATWPVPAGLDQQLAVAPGWLGKFCCPLGHVALVATAVDFNAVEPKRHGQIGVLGVVGVLVPAGVVVLALVAAAVVLIEAYLDFKAVAVLNHAAQRGEQCCVYTRVARGTIVEAAASGRS